MTNPFEKATDLALLEKLQTTKYILLLLNFGLYLITVLPLMKQLGLPAVDSPWGDMSAPCSVIFLLTGFGFINILAEWIQPFLASLWALFIYLLASIAINLNINIYNPYESRHEYQNNPNIVSLLEIESHLANNENALIKNKYEAREKYYEEGRRLRKTFLKTLFFFVGFMNFNSNNIHPAVGTWLVYGLLLFLSIKRFPWTSSYLYIAGNKIRQSKTLERSIF
jgi:hypothetical protein